MVTKIGIENYLFVCRINENRSPTAEKVCNEIAKKHKLKIRASSAGLSPFSNQKLTRKIADQADKIFVMDNHMEKTLENEYNQNSEKIVNLNIPDIYSKNDPELEIILRRELYPYLLKNENNNNI